MMPCNAPNLQTCNAMESGLMSLPTDLFHMILDNVVMALKPKKSLRVRLVNKKLAAEILYVVCKPGSFDLTDEAIFGKYWRLKHMSKVFTVGFLLPRLNLSYAVQSHYLSSILQAEELLMKHSPDHTSKERQEFRYAICAAEKWPYRELFLGDIEPIFPERKPPVEETSPLADALSAAAYMGHMELVQKLLHEGADPNFHKGYLRPPFQQAASRGHKDILLLLLGEGADVNLGYWKPINCSNYGAPRLSGLYGHERTAEFLIDCKYDLKLDITASGEVESGAWVGGHLNLIQKYMTDDISTFIRNMPGPAMSMLQRAVYRDHEHIVRWLLQNGVDISKNNPYYREMEYTPLDTAALHGRSSIVRLLLEYNVKREVPALASAAQNGHVEVAKLLLDTPGEDIDTWSMLHGRNAFYRRRRGRETPMYLAVCNGEFEMVRFLVDRGVEKHFHVARAAARGEDEILRVLLEAQARLGIDRDYSRILAWVSKQEHIPKRISNLLLELSPRTRAAAMEASNGPAEQ